MPIRHAVLALLHDHPSHGYELKAEFERGVGPQWGQLNIGHLYQVLERLVRDGLAETAVVEQSDRPDKTVYTLTDAGRDELDAWLDAPGTRSGGYRDDFFLQLFAAARQGSARLRRVIHVQQTALLGELRAVADLRDSRRTDVQGDPLVDLLLEAAVLHVQTHLRVAELADERVDDLVGLAAPTDVSHGSRTGTGQPTADPSQDAPVSARRSVTRRSPARPA